jgi:hypothetical protein
VGGPLGQIATDECHARVRLHPPPRFVQHARAGIDTRHLRGWLLPQELAQKAAVAFAEQQRVPRSWQRIKERRATALKFATGE